MNFVVQKKDADVVDAVPTRTGIKKNLDDVGCELSIYLFLFFYLKVSIHCVYFLLALLVVKNALA